MEVIYIKNKMDPEELLRSAFLAIRTNKSRSFLTTLGIVIGVASVITLVSIGTGLKNYVTDQFQTLGSNLLFVLPGKVKLSGGGGRPMSFTSKFSYDDVRNLARANGAIETASGAINRASTAEYKRKTWDVTLNGVGANYTQIRSIDLTAGRWFNQAMEDRGQSVVVVGPKVVDNLMKGEDAIGKEISISNRKFQIIGVMKSQGGGIGGAGDQDSYAYMPITTAKTLLGEKSPGSIIVKVKTTDEVDRATTEIKDYFYRRKLTDDDFTVLAPTQILSTIESFLSVITGALAGIAAISLVVGGVGIANIMLVSVTERTREIGLRKALGAQNRDILMQFLIEAIMLSAFGGIIGILWGWGMAQLINKFVTTSVGLDSVLMAFGISCAVGVISGFAPAMRAAKLNPIDALRYE